MSHLKKKQKTSYKDTFIVVPFYNEGKVLKEVINKLKFFFDQIICVDDGSTAEHKIYKSKLGIYLIKPPINLGQGAALQTGIEFAIKKKAKIIATFDADGQHSIYDLMKMVYLIKNKKYDLIQGSRFIKKTNSNVPFLRKIILKFAIMIANFFDKTNLTDTHNGLRVFNNNFAKKINITNNRMSHPHDINRLISLYKFRFKEFPTKIKYTKYSMSKGQKNLNAINILFDILISQMIKN